MLNGTNDPALAKLASKMMERHYDKGQLFYMPDDPGDTVFLLRAGRVQQYHLSLDGRKLVTAVLNPGDVFGATTLANGHRHHLFAEALDDCVVHVLDRRRVRELLLREPKTTLLLINRLAQRLSHAEEKLQALAFEPIRVRLARCLIESAENGAVEGYTHQEISELVGGYRETITMALNRFKEEGLIDIDRRRITILDCAGLHRIVNGEDVTQRGSAIRERTMLAIEPQLGIVEADTL